ncbi:MAG: M42 family metallopeptidase [Anaerolineae bacterium]|nr:M42 family metallopeptidase [Anaerolineae bacterium]
MKDTLRKLCEAYGPSGNEGQVRDLIRSEIEGLADSVRVDALGNLIAVKGSGGHRVMLAAHMDEIGVIITHIDENGFLRFAPVGGVWTLGLSGRRVAFADGTIGAIGLEKLDDRDRVPAMAKFYIDIGASKKDEVHLKVGDMAVMTRPFVTNGGRWIGKAMDNRAGCAVLIETMRRLKAPKHEVAFVFTTQEEVGLRGATTSAFGLDPEIAVAVDVTGTGDTPKAAPMAVSLGEGAAIKVRDGGMLAHLGVKDLLVQRAEENGIAYQLEVLEGGTTDGRAIQTSRAGVPTGVVSVPTRYIHSPSEMIDERDAEACASLLVVLLENDITL